MAGRATRNRYAWDIRLPVFAMVWLWYITSSVSLAMQSASHSIKNAQVSQLKKRPISGQTSIALFWVEPMKHAGS